MWCIQEENRDCLYKALNRFRQGWEQRVTFRTPQQIHGKKCLQATEGGPIISHCGGRQGLSSKTDATESPSIFSPSTQLNLI